jgi:hypothetical protein
LGSPCPVVPVSSVPSSFIVSFWEETAATGAVERFELTGALPKPKNMPEFFEADDGVPNGIVGVGFLSVTASVEDLPNGNVRSESSLCENDVEDDEPNRFVAGPNGFVTGVPKEKGSFSAGADKPDRLECSVV